MKNVIGRGMLVNGSARFGSTIAGTGTSFVVPNTIPTITTSLRVGTYERNASREGGSRRHTAKLVVEDLTAWVDANREALMKPR